MVLEGMHSLLEPEMVLEEEVFLVTVLRETMVIMIQLEVELLSTEEREVMLFRPALEDLTAALVAVEAVATMALEVAVATPEELPVRAMDMSVAAVDRTTVDRIRSTLQMSIHHMALLRFQLPIR